MTTHSAALTRQQTRRAGIGMALLSSVFFSLIPILIKMGLAGGFTPVALVAARLTAAAVMMWALFGLAQPASLKIGRRALLFCLVVAALSSGTMTLYATALVTLDAGIGHVVFSAQPLMVMIFLALGGEKIRAWSMFRLVIGMTGIGLLVGFTGQGTGTGFLLAVLAMMLSGLYIVIIQWFLGDTPAQTITLYSTTFMAILTGALFLLRGGGIATITDGGWLAVILLSIFPTILARMLMFGGIKRLGSGELTLLVPVETLLAVLWAVLFLGERLSVIQLVGSLLVITSVALVRVHQPA